MDEMNMRLQQAIAAARSGRGPQARVLVDRVLADEPENVHAWYLLSTLADSPAQQINYLNRVLEINPEHKGAQAAVATLSQRVDSEAPEVSLAPDVVQEFEPAPAEDVTQLDQLPIAQEPLDFLEQAEADTLPAWMAGEETLAPMKAAAPKDPTAISEVAPVPDEVPDWLEESAEEWLEPEDAEKGKVLWRAGDADADAIQQAASAQVAAAAAAAKRPKKKSNTGLIAILVILVVLAIVVLAALVYVVFFLPPI